METGPWGTHRVDARELLRELQGDGDDDGLAVAGGAEEFWDGDFLLLGHLGAFLLHLLDVAGHVLDTPQALEH